MTAPAASPAEPAAPTETGPAIERTLRLSASPARVWRALTDPAEFKQWFGADIGLELRPGGDGWMEWAGYGRYALRVIEAEPERRLITHGASKPDARVEDSPGTTVEWHLEAAPNGGTLLTLRESGFDPSRPRLGNVIGWFQMLGSLVDHMADEPWQHAIHRTLSLSAGPERVWRALTDPTEFSSWWGYTNELDLTPGAEGWFDFPEHGRFAVRMEYVEPPVYLAWRWCSNQKETPLAQAEEVLLTEWLLLRRQDGGTDLHLQESGHRGGESHTSNTEGWDEELPKLESAVEAA